MPCEKLRECLKYKYFELDTLTYPFELRKTDTWKIEIDAENEELNDNIEHKLLILVVGVVVGKEGIEGKMQSKMVAKRECNQKRLQNKNAIKSDCIFCFLVVKLKEMEVQL